MIELAERRRQNSKLFRLADGKNQLRISMGAVHYKDAENKWQDIDEGYSELDTAPFNRTYNKLPFGLRLSDDSTRRIYPDRNDQGYWLEFGKILPDMGLPEKIKKEVWGWRLGTYDFELDIQRSTVKCNIVLKTPAAPTSFTIPFTSSGLTREGLVFKHNGEVVGWMRKPMATDAEGNVREVDISFGAGEITLNLDTAGLAYPIRIDPTWQVGGSTDDCIRRLTPAWWSLTYASLWAGAEAVDIYQAGCGMRFTNITIPHGVAIDAAYLIFRCSQDFAGVVCNSRISAEDVDDALTFADDSDAFDTRWAARTTARVDWDAIPAWTTPNDYNSPEIKTVIQEIVNRGGWASGQAMVIFWEDFEDRSTHAEGVHRWGYAYDGSSTYAPQLVITYTPGLAERQVSASSDDCYRRLADPSWSLVVLGQVAGSHDAVSYKAGGGMRFTNVLVPQGATILEAYITLHADATSGTVCNSRISAEDVDDAPTFADSAAAFDARWANRTTARVDWDAIPAWLADVNYNSPEIKTVIQEIVDRVGWASGQDMVIFWEDFDGRSSVGAVRAGDSYDLSPTYAPKLVITYLTPNTNKENKSANMAAKMLAGVR